MASHFTLAVDASLDPSRFAALSRDLQSTLSQQDGLQASYASEAPGPSDRAIEIPLMHQLLVGFVGVGALKALIECLQAYITRERSLTYEITTDDGKTLKLSAKDFSTGNIDQLASTLKTFLH